MLGIKPESAKCKNNQGSLVAANQLSSHCCLNLGLCVFEADLTRKIICGSHMIRDELALPKKGGSRGSWPLRFALLLHTFQNTQKTSHYKCDNREIIQAIEKQDHTYRMKLAALMT